jgi:hypothetical protein
MHVDSGKHALRIYADMDYVWYAHAPGYLLVWRLDMPFHAQEHSANNKQAGRWVNAVWT